MNERIETLLEKFQSGEKLADDELRLMRTFIKLTQSIFYEHIVDTPFISGHMGKVREGDRMPEYFQICPTYGCDFSVLYKRIDKQ